uniref:Uncharacterized protein n=1 Tax=Oryza punctata TaxID=4537 RepID=A0A0E0LSJ3_ORYPU
MNVENKGTTTERYHENRAQKLDSLHMDKNIYATDKDLNNKSKGLTSFLTMQTKKMSTLQNGRTRKSQHSLFAQCKCLNTRTVVWLVYAEVYGALE